MISRPTGSCSSWARTSAGSFTFIEPNSRELPLTVTDYASNIDVGKSFLWQQVDLQNGAELSLGSGKVDYLVDDEQSWLKPGKLILDGLEYTGLGQPVDAASRLRWLGLQPPGYHPQPYRQLAKFLRESGDEQGAMQVLVAKDDARYSRFGATGAFWGEFLKWTIGYGHRPLLGIVWMLGVVVVGWLVVLVGKRAAVMRLTWPETTPPSGDPTTGLNPLLYSLDVFVPFVNLHQEHYWWPDETASGSIALIGSRISVSGSTIRVYLWLQIIAGWLLTAIFIAGVTGLVRNE